ncbi:hypothetical protein AK88_02641 [Plasmodium fragile]|uniref:HYDIN/VesB/CFA65-like Ig-like domain-containing protein n=1 Tax=Plasmodium fragile TaxID=5857 RepID=A0A0D9QPY3_PLAFR|nr:uncharacterized protein AK88_02641 [Plasmodium fragile]KJP87746.1 hypothetical protein AK88_02641 [Plasmodium fragile]
MEQVNRKGVKDNKFGNCGNKEKNATCGEEEEREGSPFLTPAYFVHNREKALKEFIRKKNENMTKRGILKNNISCKYFQITPDIVTFTSYAPFKKYERVVTLKNVDANARNLKLGLGENHIFKVKYISDIKKKVAPGMLFTFKVEFYPQSCENYEYDLEIQTEGTSFTLPIRCMNDEIILDVQDEIKMNETPIYMKSEKSITIKNIGKYENKFQISIAPPFYVNSSIHVLKEGEMIETKITFLPVQKRTYEDYMIINYENGIRTYTNIRGEGIVAEVLIKDKDLTAEDVYINTRKEINIFIKNLSFFLLTYNITKYNVYESKYDDPSTDIKDVTFDEGDRIIQKTFIRDSELLDENIVENALYKNDESLQRGGESGVSSGDCSGGDSSSDDHIWGTTPSGDNLPDGEPHMESEECDQKNDTFDSEPSDRSNISHYDEPKRCKKQTKKNIIDIFPKCKKLYSETNTPLTVALCPKFASFYKIVIFLFIRGYKKEEKIVVYLKSIAPEIVIAERIHRIDSILINTCKRLSFELVNNTQFDVPMKIEKVEDNYNEFEVARGNFTVLKNSTHSLEMVYMPKVNGTSEKTFIIHQKYTNVKRKLQVVSKCNFPQVLLDIEEINFNQVSHSFEYKKIITIVNNSELTLHYGFNIPNELKDEVKIEKNCNQLNQFGEEKIVLSFYPKQIKTYMTSVELYLSEIKTFKKNLAFRAICSKPNVLCEPVFLNIEPMIIDKMYTEQINLINKSEDTDVKYELFVDEEISCICDLHISHKDGVIKRNQVQSVHISIKSKIIGYILIVIKVKIFGCADLLFLNIKAYCTCPTVKIIPSIIDFEKCNCLDVKEKVIEIKNESPINTFISLSNELPVFSFSKNNFYIEPHECVFVPVFVECLDTTAYMDTLRVNVHRKEDILVPLKAQGVGSPILVNHSGINFEVTHTGKKYVHELIISNRGTSERSVYFLFESEKKRKKKNESPEIFGVTPRSVSIKGGSEAVCIVSALNCKEEKCEDILYVHEDTIGKKKVCASFKKIKIEASFVHPEIEICDIANFVYDFNEQGGVEKDDLENRPTEKCQNSVDERRENRSKQCITHSKNMNKLMQEVEMKNLRNANVKFILSTKLPFSMEQEVIELRPMERKKNRIFFDVDFMNNKISNTYQDHLIVHFVENGRRQKYELLGKTIYPNIVMSKSSVDFQYILKNLCAQETVEIKNVCNFKVYFQWFFEENNMYANFNQVFNIIPHRGFLLPYEKKQITLTYNSINESYYNVNVLCQIRNGPIYPLKLIGGYSDIKYSINKRELNYDLHYKSVGEDFITIQNTGKIKLFVEIVYNIKFPSLLYTNVNNFFIEPHNSKDIIFYFIPGIPQNVKEVILLKICNFEEIKVTLHSRDRSNVLLLTVQDVEDGCADRKNGELADEVYPQECDPNRETENWERKKSKFNPIDTLISKALLPFNENSHYENQRRGLIQKLKSRYAEVFLSLGRHIEEILALYHDRAIGVSAQGVHTETNDEQMGIIGDADEVSEVGELGESVEVYRENQMDNVSGGSTKRTDASEGLKRKYNLIGILKSYCAKNSSLCCIFSDLLKCFILNQKDDKYILGSFSKLKKLANFEKLSCHGYVSNEYILKYLKRVILENNSELQRVYLNMGNVTIKEKKEGVITLKNVSRDKVKLSYHLGNPEMKDIITLACEHKEVDKDDSINLKIIIDNKFAKEKLFSEQMFICMNDKNYYTVDINFNYIIPDLHIYYRQIHFEKVEVKKCLCKTNRLINTKNVNVKFKVKNIIFFNKKLEYYHLKKKAQIFIIPSKGIIKSNSFLDIRIFFEPSDVYKNAKVSIELFIYHSNFTKSMDVYLNSVRDHVQADPSDIIVKPLLLNSGNVHHNMKITNFNNYSKYLFIYNLDNYYKYFQSFLYDLLSIHSHIYIEKNDESDFFYSNLMDYLVGLYRRQLDRIRNCNQEGTSVMNGDLNSYVTQSWHNSEEQEERQGVTHETEGVKLDDENKIGERNLLHVEHQKGRKLAEGQCKDKKGKYKSKKMNETEREKGNDKTDELTNKKEKLNDILADCIPPTKDDSKGVGTIPNEQQRNIKILENKIAILDQLIQTNERKYNYFEEYLNIIKIKKKIKQNFLLICPKYVNHKGIGSYLVNNTVLNFSPLKKTETGIDPENDNLLTIGEIIRWCKEINEKDNYPSSVKRSFIHYIMHERNINRNRHSTKKLRTSNRSMNERLANAACSGLSALSGQTQENSLDYYVSEVLNVGEKRRDQEQADDDINTNDGMKINGDKDSHLILKGGTFKQPVGVLNEHAHDAKDTRVDNEKDGNCTNVGKNKLKKTPNLRSIKSKIDNKHAISMQRKKNNCRNDHAKNNDGGSLLDQKAFFNKYNLRHNSDFVKHFFHFSLLNDENFMNDVQSFLKLTMTERKKNKGENSNKKNSTFANLFEIILQKVLLSPLYVNGVVFFFKKNEYINSECFFTTVLRLTSDENNHIIYLNPVEGYEEFFNPSNGVDRKKNAESEGGKRSDAKENQTTDAQRLKYFYENMTKKYQEKIERKLKEKQQIEKILESLSGHTDSSNAELVPRNVDCSDKKKGDIEQDGKNANLEGQTEEVGEYSSCVEKKDGDEFLACSKKGESWEDTHDSDMLSEKGPSTKKDVQCMNANVQSAVERLYEKFVVCKEKKILNKQITGQLKSYCVERNAQVDEQIIKYNKKVSKINSYMKSNDYVEHVSFYKELKTVLRNLLRDHIRKGTDNYSSKLACPDMADPLACNEQKGETSNNYTEQSGKEKRSSMYVRRINIQLGDNFVETIYQEDGELKNVSSGVIDGVEITGQNNEEEEDEIGKVAESTIKTVEGNNINKKFDSKYVQMECGGGKDRIAVSEKMPNGGAAERCNQVEESVKTVVNKNEELVRYLKQTFVQVNFIYFFINEELCFRKRNVLNEISKIVQEKYRDVKTSAYFFDIPNSKRYDAFNMQSFMQIKNKVEKCECNFYVTNEKDQVGVVSPRDGREEDNVVKEESHEGELPKGDAQVGNELHRGKSKRKKKEKKKENSTIKEAKNDNAENEKEKLEDAGDEHKSEKKEKRRKKKKKRSAKEGEEQQKGKVQEEDVLADPHKNTEKNHKESENVEGIKKEKEQAKSKDEMEEKKRKGRKKEKEKKKDTLEKLDESAYKKEGEAQEHRNDLDSKGAKSENKGEEGKEAPNKNATSDSDAHKLYLYGGKELTQEAYFEQLENKKYEIKDEYDHIFYNFRNIRAVGDAAEREKKEDHYIIEFLEVDKSYDQRDEIRYKNITHVMLQKNTSTEINIKINTCKIVNIKKRICLIDLLGNYFYLNLLVVIDKPKIYSNPYFIFSNNVVMCAPRSNCFVLCKKLYNFDRVLIGRNVHSFRHIIQTELKDECEEHLLNFLKIFTNINSPKIKLAKMRKQNITSIWRNSSGNEQDKYKLKNSDRVNNNEISKHLYKHVQVLNLFNSSPFDSFVEISFDSVPCSSDKNYQANELNSVDNFISHNDFYVYPKKFFILSKKWKKIIVLFLPKKVGSFFEKLQLSIYSIAHEAVTINNKKEMTNGERKKHSAPLCDSRFSNDIDLDNKQIHNYLYDIFSLCLKGEGIMCCLKMSENYLNFHKILLNSVQQKNVEIKNCSYCDLAWFVDPADLKSDTPLCINPTKGNLLKNEKKTLTVTIKTDIVNAIKKEIKINYVEKNFSKNDKMRNNVYFTSLVVEAEVCKSFIQVSTEMVKEDSGEKFDPLAESAIVGRTILKANGAAMKESPPRRNQLLPAHLGDVLEEDINFKYVQVNQTKTCLFKVKNTGKFKIFYVAELNEDSFLNYVSMECLTDNVNSNEMKIIKLKVRSGRTAKFQNVPLMIHFYDMENNHIQTYKYSISVFFDYNYVRVIPAILNYDSVEVKKEETRFFKIMNDGHFDFKYEIKLLKSKIRNTEKDEVVRYNNVGCVPYNSNADLKSPFSISPISGLVKSKGEATVMVQFNSSEERQYKFVYIVEVENLMSDTLPNDSKKKEHRGKKQHIDNHKEIIKIFASSVKPTISLDVKNIFEEVLILKKAESYANFLDHFLGKNSYYNSDDNTLYYRWCHVNECINERIKICNTSDVNAKVLVEIKELEFANYRNKGGKGKEKEREKRGYKGKENENETKRSSVIVQQSSPIRFNMRIQNDNEIKSKWCLTELNAQRRGVTYGDASSCVSTTTEVTRYQHKYLDICFYSNQIGSKKFLVNIYLTNQQNLLCFSFYISVEFFLPSINLIIPQSLLKQRREDNIYDLGDIHLNSVMSFKVKLKNCFKYPVFVKVFFERINVALDCWRGMEERKGQLKGSPELESVPNKEGDINEHGRAININLLNDTKEAQHDRGDAKNSNASKSTYGRSNPCDEAYYQTCVKEKKDIYNAINCSSYYSTVEDHLGLRIRNNTTYIDYKNVNDLLYKDREKKMHMFSLGYLYYIGHSNYMIRENETESIKIKVDKKILEEMIKRRNAQRGSLKEIEGEECKAVNAVLNDLDAIEQTPTSNDEFNNKGLEVDKEKAKKSVKEKLKRDDLDKKKDANNVRGNLTKFSTTPLSTGQEKQLLGSIQISVLNNNYEFYNLKFVGNIVETNNYWNLELLKSTIRNVYNGKNVDIFKNHINFDLLPVGYNHSFKVPYVNENNHDLFFHVEVEKKIKNVIDIRPLSGSIPANSSFPVCVQINIKEAINLVKKQILFKFSANPFSKKNTKVKDEDGVCNDSLYVSLTSEEIKFSYSKKKIIFKNVPFFNYSKSELVLENMSNVKLDVELNIVPLNGLDDITSVYAFRPFSEQRITSLMNKMDKNLLMNEVTEEKTTQLGNSPVNCKQGGDIKNTSEGGELVGDTNKSEDRHVVGNPNGVHAGDETGENKPIDEFYLTKYDLTLSDFGDNLRHREGSGFNETHILENDVIGECREIIGNGNVTSKPQQQCRVIKKFITIKGKQKKRLELFCFHHLYKKTVDAVLHIRIKYYNQISIPIKMTFENYNHSNVFVLTGWNHNGVVANMEEKKNVPKAHKMFVLSRGMLQKIHHKIYMLNISNENLQYFFEKISETPENRGRSPLLLSSGKQNVENKKNDKNNDNNSECINYKGCVNEYNISLIRFLFNIFNSVDYSGRYNLYVNDKKEQYIDFDLKVIEPLIFFNTSSIHINNLILGKSYCFVFYLINFDLMDINFEFDQNSYNSCNSKKETIRIVPFRGVVKSCYRKNKYMYKEIRKLNEDNSIGVDDHHRKGIIADENSSSGATSTSSNSHKSDSNGNGILSDIHKKGALIGQKKSVKKRIKVNYVNHYKNISLHNDSDNWSSSLTNSSDVSASSSNLSSGKNKVEQRAQNERTMLYGRYKKEYLLPAHSPQCEHINTSCDSGSDSDSEWSSNAGVSLPDGNNGKDGIPQSSKYFLLHYYLRNIWKMDSNKFVRDIKHVGGKGRCKKIKLFFKPHLEQFYNFNLLCKIGSKETPLQVNFKTQVSKININCYIENFDKEKVQLNLKDSTWSGKQKKYKSHMIHIYDLIDFKETLIGQKKVSKFVIENLGNFDMVYKYYLQKKDEDIRIECSQDCIPQNSTYSISVEYNPLKNQTYVNYLTINIMDYYLINIKITAVAISFLINFSFYNYDFGNVMLFPVLDDTAKVKGITNTDQIREDSISSSDSSLSSLIHTFKNNERDKRVKEREEEKAKALSGEDAQGTTGKHKKGKKKKHKKEKQDKKDRKTSKDKTQNGMDEEGDETKTGDAAEHPEKDNGGDKSKEGHKEGKRNKEKHKTGTEKSKGEETEHEKDQSKTNAADLSQSTKRGKDKVTNVVGSKIKEGKMQKGYAENEMDVLSEKENNNAVETKLVISNNNDVDCYIEYELNEECLTITNLGKKIHLKRKSKICLLIQFKPNEEKNYNYKIPFMINADVDKMVYIYLTGSATHFKLPFSSNNSNEIYFENVHVDKESISKFTLHNKNSEDISFNVLNYAYLEKHYLSFVKFDNSVLHILHKKEKKTFEVKFLPEKYLNLQIPLYLSISYRGKRIAYYLTSIKLKSICYKIVLKENLLTFNKAGQKEERALCCGEATRVIQAGEVSQVDEVKEKLFKGAHQKDSIKGREIQLHNRGDMNAQFQVVYPQKYDKFLHVYPKKGIIFSFNLTSIYIFVDTDFVTKDLFLNDVSVDLLPKFNKINSKIFLNIFINTRNDMNKCRSGYVNNSKLITAGGNVQSGETVNDRKTAGVEEDQNEDGKKQGADNSEKSEKKEKGEITDYDNKNVSTIRLKNETIVTFLTDIRKQISKTIEIYNETESNFKMKYKFLSHENNFFSLEKHEDVVKPNESGTFQIVYNPLFVQKRKNNSNNCHNTLCLKYLKYFPKIHHISKLVIYYPKDVVKNYTLLGYANSITYDKKKTFNFKSKVLNSASIRIKNWLNENQTLFVSSLVCDKDLNISHSDCFFFYIQNKLELSNKEEKNMPFKVISLKEATYHVMLTFSNEKYKDAYKILLQFEITKSEFLSIKNVKGNKKEILKEQVSIYNPLDENIKMDAVLDYTYAFLDKSIILQSKKNNNINIYFCIVRNEIDKDVTISFANKTTGTYKFKFILNVNMNDFDDNFYFNTDLGSIQINEISFTNVCNQKINYDVVIEDYDDENKNSKQIFQCVDKSLSAKSVDTNLFLKNETLNNLTEKINLTVKYNPPDVQTHKAILKLLSKEGIIYKGLLIGKSVAPKPKGPIFCSSQKTTLISFTNPFFHMKQFFLKTDEFFSVPFEVTKVEARQTVHIPVKCKATSAISGKLIIKSEDDITWMYYLTGQ